MNDIKKKQRCLKCGHQVFRPDVMFVMSCKVCDFASKEEEWAESQRRKAISAQLSPPTKENLPLAQALGWLGLL